VRLDDPRLVREEYASERGLEGRRSAYRYGEGPNAPELVFRAVAEVAPRKVLEVGCGPGELSARIADDLGAEVIALDSSPRMVELAQAHGVDARLGDVQDLPFADGTFDCAVAAWMLYHVPDVGRALAELARVLRPGGRLVAVTNAAEHWRELHHLLGCQRPRTAFAADDAERLLTRHFPRVEARDASGWIVFPSRAEAQQAVDASIVLAGRPLPLFDGPLRVRCAPWIFVAET
jgi:SAM-dependent methyltransferase